MTRFAHCAATSTTPCGPRAANPVRPIGKFAIAFAVLAVLAPAPRDLSAQLPISLEGLVVTASRWAQPAWTVTAHATVIDGSELRRAGIEYVADALRRVPGLAVVRTGALGALVSGFMPSVSLRPREKA